MANHNDLAIAYKQTSKQLGGNGFRTVQVLKEAFGQVESHLESDMYGQGAIIEAFENKMSNYLGKEKAVFFPSGTMAQQIALRIWCDQKNVKRVAYHPLSHLEIHEEDGLKKLHLIEPILLGNQDRVITLEDVIGLKEDISCLLLELPQREIGGQLPDYETLEAISKYCHEKGIKLHLDGARLFEVLPFYKKTAAEISSLFDSVYVSVYKGIGGIAGAILAGDQSFMEKSIVWKRRHGGDLISLYPYVVSADYYFNQRVEKMEQYYQDAKELASLFNQCDGVSTKPLQPVSNMFHVQINRSKEEMTQILITIMEETRIGVTNHLKELSEDSCYYEVSLGDQYRGITKDQLRNLFDLLAKQLRKTGEEKDERKK